MPKPIRVVLVNDYMIVLEGLRALLKSSEPEIEVVEIDVRKGPRRGVDVTLLDTYGELESLGERVRSLGADSGNGAIVVFSFSDRPEAVRRAMRAGAQGFISKAVPRQQIIDGIDAAARGERVVLTQRSQHAQIDEALRWPGREIGLTERESELLSLLSTGMTNRELGSHLYVSENTIKTQLRSLYAKLGVRNRAQAASLAGRGILGDHRRQTQARGLNCWSLRSGRPSAELFHLSGSEGSLPPTRHGLMRRPTYLDSISMSTIRRRNHDAQFAFATAESAARSHAIQRSSRRESGDCRFQHGGWYPGLIRGAMHQRWSPPWRRDHDTRGHGWSYLCLPESAGWSYHIDDRVQDELLSWRALGSRTSKRKATTHRKSHDRRSDRLARRSGSIGCTRHPDPGRAETGIEHEPRASPRASPPSPRCRQTDRRRV